jgi:hypothetical protein
MGKSISNIIKVCTTVSIASNLFSNLSKGSNVLFELSRDFAQKLQNLTVITFYEMDKTEILGLTRKLVLKRKLVCWLVRYSIDS